MADQPPFSSPFDQGIRDPDEGFAEEIVEGAPLVVAFGGIAGGLGMPPFEFFRLVSDWPMSKIFLRDLDQVWYQRGVRGIGPPRAVVSYLRARKVSRTLFVGNSAGGFGALFFGAQVGADVLAFAPQTYLGRWRRAVTRDHRWSEQARAVHRVTDACLDVRPRLGPNKVAVHYDKNYRLDAVHARRLGSRVELVPHTAHGHALVAALRQSGELEELLRSALGLDT